MNSKIKICVVTGTRAEYGLLYWLMKEIQATKNLELQIIATGMHLSPEFGLTYQHIEKDGFTIDEKVVMLLSSDSEVGITKSMGLAMIGFADALRSLKPDMMVVLGDRFEIFSAASAATVAKIPIAHIHGGETTEGAFDEVFRHSITKMSHLHFTSTEEYRNRVIQLGEHPDRVFNFGAIGIDSIKRLTLLSRTEFEESIGFNLGKKNLLITFHPVTLEMGTAKKQFDNLLLVLDKMHDTNLIFTKANSDTDGRVINEMIDDFVNDRKATTVAFTSLGQMRYLSAMQYVDGVVGNSSSGIIEVPSFTIGTINIGDRQKGRIKGVSVIDTPPSISGISNSLRKLYTKEFQESIKNEVNPYGQGGVSKKIKEILISRSSLISIKKEFFNLKG
ncbi:MAG: UDP-N-acetylglucosamine 2-epimerase (hydrolyzing) [Rickettsiales bacterium]|nr:UDP-N-acetylglucosamine 2-epimerase (hydrolyzing) [Rickettsiales bacterium]